MGEKRGGRGGTRAVGHGMGEQTQKDDRSHCSSVMQCVSVRVRLGLPIARHVKAGNRKNLVREGNYEVTWAMVFKLMNDMWPTLSYPMSGANCKLAKHCHLIGNEKN